MAAKIEISLPTLQTNVKHDPDGYKSNFEQQYRHFQTTLETLQEAPHKVETHFSQLIMFLAHTSPLYEGVSQLFIGELICLLKGHFHILHSSTRTSIVRALISLRNAKCMPLLDTPSKDGSQQSEESSNSSLLPLWFKIFTESTDRKLKQQLVDHIVKDILRNQSRTQKNNHQSLQTYFYNKILGADAAAAQRAIVIVISLYRRKLWLDTKTVNVLASACFSKIQKVALAAAHFLMGNLKAESVMESSDEEKGPSASEIARQVACGKKTKGHLKKLKRAKEAAEKQIERRNAKRSGYEGAVTFTAIDALYDPHSFAEKLLKRITSRHESFAFRLPMITLISRLIGRHQLLLLNFYTFIQKFLFAKQSKVTVILAALAQSCHELVPPHELHPVVQMVITNFVAEHQTPEVVVVGLNTLREIASRAPLAISESLLEFALQFRTFRNKDIANGTRALINLYREVYPSLLHRKLRGKDASVAVIAGTDARPEYGRVKESDVLEGAKLLFEVKRRAAALENFKLRRSKSKADRQVGDGSNDGQDDTDACVSGRYSRKTSDATEIDTDEGDDADAEADDDDDDCDDGISAGICSGSEHETDSEGGSTVSCAEISRLTDCDVDENDNSDDSLQIGSQAEAGRNDADRNDAEVASRGKGASCVASSEVVGKCVADDVENSVKLLDDSEQQNQPQLEVVCNGNDTTGTAPDTRDNKEEATSAALINSSTAFDLTSQILTQKDISKITRLKSICDTELSATGKKRQHRDLMLDDAALTELQEKLNDEKHPVLASGTSGSSDVTDGSDDDDDDGDDTSQTGMDAVVNPADLFSRTTKKRKLSETLREKAKADKKEYGPRKKCDKKHSIPNVVQARNKPFVMVRQKRMVTAKRLLDCKSRVDNIRKHMKGLKKKTGGRKKFRKL